VVRAYDAAVSLLASVLLAAVALLAGLGGGVVLGRRPAPVREERTGPVDEPGPPLADLLLRVFRSSDAGLAVLTGSGEVVLHNPRAVELGLVSGGVVVGDVPTFRAEQMPYGGVKESGIGREGVRSAMDDYTEPRVMVFSGVAL
jgi:hypothetical protein